MTYTLLPLERRPRTPEPRTVIPASVELERAVYEVVLEVAELEEDAPLRLIVQASVGASLLPHSWKGLCEFVATKPGQYRARADVTPLLHLYPGHSYTVARVVWGSVAPTRFGLTLRPLGAGE